MMTWPKRAAATILLIGVAAVAAADQWNDRTKLTFDAPMMIPGATLPPGTYTFKLFDSKSNRHIVQIFNEDGTKLVATANAIPAKRMEATGDVVLKLNPTEAGAPAAIKSWFYPGSLYGHQFVYSDPEARQIAQRTKTLVLSDDGAGENAGKGTLYTYDAEGKKNAWREDTQLISEWNLWSEKGRRAAEAKIASPGTAETRESTAPMMRSRPEGTTVRVGELEEDPKKYIGKTINVTAEVDDIFGPRLFKIDEPNWADLDGEVLVYLPSNLAALVRDDDRVTVTGTMKMFVKADIERELGWLEPDPGIEIEFTERPLLVASSIVGGNNERALAIEIGSRGDSQTTARNTAGAGGTSTKAVGTTGTASGTTASALTDVAAIATGDQDLVGRQVDLDRVKVTHLAKNHGFWIQSGGASVFVLPAQHADSKPAPATAGRTVSIEGVVLQMPRSMRDRATPIENANEQIYVYATTVE